MHRSKQNHYSITSSARSWNSRLMVRPSACAVLRLMASSNLVGCSMGRSPALRALENFVHVARGATKQVRQAGPVGGKPARRDELGLRIDGRQLASERERSHPVAIAE